MKRRIRASVLVIGIFLALATPAWSADLGKEGYQWREIYTFSPASNGRVVWCGPSKLVVESRDLRSPRDNGGIALIDLETKKVRWLLRYPYFKDPFPSHDCSSVFYYRFLHDPTDEEEAGEDGIWLIDVKTGRQKRVGGVSTDPFQRPASPKEKVYALVRRYEKKPVEQLKIDLQGWKILRFPRDDREVGSGLWASDGSYIVLTLSASKNGQCFAFYNPDGKLLKEVMLKGQLRLADKVAHPEGVYLFGQDGVLKRVSTKTWYIEDLPFNIVLKKDCSFWFDVSPNGEIAYTRHEEGGGVWIGSVSGFVGKRVSEEGSLPSFSNTGELVALTKAHGKGNQQVVVLKKTQVQ